MPESHHPLFESGYYTGTSSSYQNLFKYIPNPERIGYINSITIYQTTASMTASRFKLLINGKEVMKDRIIPRVLITLRFGDKLLVRGGIDKGIELYVKSDGVTTIEVTAILTGIEVEK